MRSFLMPCCLVLFCVMAPLAAEPAAGQNWPSFRGAAASGVAEDAATATTWDVAANKNVKWKTQIPGLGFSSPVVWADRIYLTTAAKEGEQKLKVGLYGNIQSVEDNDPVNWRVLCFDRATGKLLWDRTANQGVPKI